MLGARKSGDSDVHADHGATEDHEHGLGSGMVRLGAALAVAHAGSRA